MPGIILTRTRNRAINSAASIASSSVSAKFGATYEAFLERLPPADRAAVSKAYTESLASREPYTIDHRIQMEDGSLKAVCERCQTFYDQEGKPLRSVGTVQDITARKQEEEALRAGDEQLRMIAESVPQLVWMCRPDGWNIYFNQRWVEYTGLSLNESYGHGWNKPFHPDDQLRAWNAWKRATETGGSYDLECRLRRADGSYRWFLIRGVPVRDSKGVILKWFGTCTDIDDRKKAEEKIRALNARLKHYSVNLEREVSSRTADLKESIKSLETLTYSIAHDLRAPIRAMSNFSTALLEDVPLNETGRGYVKRIYDAAERMNQLVNDLLDYGLLTHTQFPLHTVSLKAQIEKVLRQLAENIQKKKASIWFEEPMPLVLGNERLLERVLSNLLSNALKFVPRGVCPEIILRSQTHGATVRLWVKDNGIGIDPQYHRKIFDIFIRLHPSEDFTGTGVGLAIVKQAVERMHGRVGLESQPGKGCKFWIELRLAGH